jgi:hypothetical protein
MPAGAEVMPCIVGGCSGSWVYAPGMRLSTADPDAAEPPVDRMCDDCREQRGAPGRDPRRMPTSDEGATDDGAHDEGALDANDDAAPDDDLSDELASLGEADGEGELDGEGESGG